MADGGDPILSLEDQLAGAVASGQFPAKVQKQAESLLARLQRPTRVSVLGLPGSGKSEILNLLAGAQIVPWGVELGTIKLSHGAQNRTKLILPDGTDITFDDLPNEANVVPHLPVMTEIEAPLPALSKISLMEIGKAPDVESQRKAMVWAARHTDIAIWCTQRDFDREEQTLWTLLSEDLRDHAILLRTRSETLAEDRASVRVELQCRVGSDFEHVICISAKEAEAAKAGDTIDKDMLRASGGMKLISTLLQDIERGRQNLIDHAELMMAQHGLEGLAPPTPVARPVTAPLEEPAQAEDPSSAEPTIAENDAATETDPAPEAEPQTEEPPVANTPEEDPTEDAAEPTPEVEDASLHEATVIAFDEAAARLRQVGSDLVTDDAPDQRKILNASVEVLTWLDEHLSNDDLPDHPELERFRVMTQDANDLVQLLKLEDSEDASLDAVSVLLQLNRGFLAAVAA